MTLIIPPGFGNAAFIFGGSAGTPEHVTTLGVDLSEFAGNYVDAANLLFIRYFNAFSARTTNTLILSRVNLAVGQDGSGGSVDSDVAPANMTRSGTPEAVSMSVILRKVTNDLGRRGRGRMFLPGTLNSADTNLNGQVDNTVRTAIQTAADAFYNALVNPPGGADPATPPVLLHSMAPADPTPITGFTAANLVGWVRGRIR